MTTQFTSVKEVIRRHRPQSLKLSMARVKSVIQEAGYQLVPAGGLSNELQLTQELSVDGIFNHTWILKDIEVGGYKVYRQDDGSYQIYMDKNPRAKGELVSLEEVLPVLENNSYQLYYPTITNGQFGVYPIGPAPKWHGGVGFSCFAEDELTIWWEGKVVGDTLTYDPYIPGSSFLNTELPAAITTALLHAAGAKQISTKLEISFIKMPIPDWVEAAVVEYHLETEYLESSQALMAAQQFLISLSKAGVLPSDAVVMSASDVEALISYIPNDNYPNSVQLVNRILKLLDK